ncbi:MAG: lycopene cyclase domain-containing protein [Rhodothermales bacterium]|nr:lycopene cyclase domain-containing protein [Rhodothermales bacterium]
MTYLQFHFVFLVPLLVIMSVLVARSGALTRRRAAGTAILVVVALIYSTPWDNYLVYRSVWSYGADRVIATIGYVPIEEYLFFILQTLLTALIYSYVARNTTFATVQARGLTLRLVGIIAFGVLTAVGVAFLYFDSTLYLGLITAWAAPILALQWGFGAEMFFKYGRIWVRTIIPLTIYLWFADATAIRLGIWDIADATTTGIELFGLPIEEALFFLVTTVFVGQGMLLFDGWKPHKTQ